MPTPTEALYQELLPEHLALIKEQNNLYSSDPIICVNSKDWDLNSIHQKAVPWAKRL